MSNILDALNDVPSFFSTKKDSGFLTPEQLETRRKIAIALAGRRSGYPKNIGEGLTALGEGLADRWAMQELDAKEQQSAKQMQELIGANTPYAPSAAPPPAAPAAPPVQTPSNLPAQPPPQRSVAPAPMAAGAQGAQALLQSASLSPQSEEIQAPKPPLPMGNPPSNLMPVEELMSRTKRVETGGRKDPYSVVGVRSRRGDYPYGAYQVMGENIPKWSQEHLGRSMTPQEFLDDPQAQDQIAKAQLLKYQQQFGNDKDVAAAWFAGPNFKKNMAARDALGTNVVEYQRRFSLPDRGAMAASLANQPVPSPLAGAEEDARLADVTGVAQQPRVQLASLQRNQPTGDAPPPSAIDAGIANSVAERRAGIATTAPTRIAQAPGAQPQFQKAPTAPDNPYPYATSVIGQPLRPEPKPPTPESPSREELQWSNIPPQMIGTRYEQVYKQQAAQYAAARARRDAEAQANYQEQIKLYAAELAKYRDTEAGAPKERAELAASGQKLEDAKLRTSGIDKSVESSAQIPTTIQTLRSIQDNLNKGVFTGLLSPLELIREKALAQAGFPPDPRIATTEQLRADLAAVAGAKRLAVVGPGAPSNKDMELLERAAAGNITFDEKTIREVTAASERVTLGAALAHQKKLEQFGRENPQMAQTMYERYGLPMEDIVPREAVNHLLKVAPTDPGALARFDQSFKTPGLAARILERHQ